MINNNDIRNSLNKMRNFNTDNKSISSESKKTIKNHSMRDMLSITRNINEDTFYGDDKKNKFDQKQEEFKMDEYFSNNNVDIDYIDIEVYDNAVFWGGTIDNQIQFVYTVTPDEKTSGFEINYLEGFDRTNPENEEIIKKIERYYNEFYKYWRDNELDV